MDDKKIVKMLIDDIEVEGIVSHRCSCDFTIKIIKPFQNISRGSHIPCFSRAHMTFDGDYGDKIILETLRCLYTLGKYLTKEMNNLKEKLNYFTDIIAKLSLEMATKDKFKIKRIELRKRLRNSEIDNKEYQKLLTPFRKESEQLEIKIFLQMDSFFEKNFPMIVPIGTREEVIDIIKGKKRVSRINQRSEPTI